MKYLILDEMRLEKSMVFGEFKAINFCDEYVKTLSWRFKILSYYLYSFYVRITVM